MKTELEKSCFFSTEEPMSQKLKELPSLYSRKQYSQICRDEGLENRKNISHSPVISIPLLEYFFLGFCFPETFFLFVFALNILTIKVKALLGFPCWSSG